MQTSNNSGWRRLGVLILVAILARGLTIGNPIVHVDEEFYLVVARAMSHGALPFVDIWDRKPIGLFLIYLPAAALPLPWAIYGYQAIAFASAVGTAWIIARLADRAGWRVGGTAGATSYLLWLSTLGGVGGQAPVFFNLAMAAAGLLIIDADGRRRRLRGVAAMMLVGVALQIKYSVVFEGLYFGLWLLAMDWRLARSTLALVAYGAAMVAVALIPTAAAWAFYASAGQSDAFIFANFTSILARNPDPLTETLGNAATLMLILSPLIAMAAGSRGRSCGGDRFARLFLGLWLGAALAGLAVFGSYFDHYGLPVLVPGCACAAGFLGTPQLRRQSLAILTTIAVAGLITTLINRANRGTPRQFAALAGAIGRGSGCLYVYSGSTMLYAATGRCMLSHYVFPSHLGRQRENGAIGVDQAGEVRRILAAGPAIVVMRPPYRGERTDIRALVMSEITQHFRTRARVRLGNETISVYARR
ncbi:hypothetical protein ACT009_09375 [Sphingomonas sp. Tas61C01]|uniref:hypothetical protein n=1 Tax=Sphingomonas sp. Tas61C01 TaxID=3458297 RepID=UPI00403E9D98